MVPIRYTTYSARELASGILLLIRVVGGCFLVLIALGLMYYPAVGSASLDPAFGFASDIFPQLSVPLVWLGTGVCLLLELTGFGYRCLAMESETGSDGMLLRLIRRFRALALWPSILHVISPPSSLRWDGLLSPSSSSRMVVPCAASASGASPQLE